MRRLFLLGVTLLFGCVEPTPEDFVGHWSIQDCKEERLCSFTIEKRHTEHAELYVKFDKDWFSKTASGPFIDKGNGLYHIKGSMSSIPLTLEDGTLHTLRDSVYVKDKH